MPYMWNGYWQLAISQLQPTRNNQVQYNNPVKRLFIYLCRELVEIVYSHVISTKH